MSKLNYHNSCGRAAALPRQTEVLTELGPLVRELITAHEARRFLWYPSELLEACESTHAAASLRSRAREISEPALVALALNLLTEEGLPHYHRAISTWL